MCTTNNRYRYSKVNYAPSRRDAWFLPEEKQILELFLLNPEVCITKSDLQEKFWNNKNHTITTDNTINVTICNLRKKL